MNVKNIRNFSIIAHIDHGKSTLSDRLLEVTGTVEKRKMKDQVLDSMELERERGITIKMQPVRMVYKNKGEDYILNLIDTPGHIDFSYEVSRALKAVEGTILLVDATKGIQAQTLSVLHMAREQNLVIIPAINKVDLPFAKTDEVKQEISKVLGCDASEILEVSGKTGFGVDKLLNEIVSKIPHPKESTDGQQLVQGLVFDFEFSAHKGVIVYIRIFDGQIKTGDSLVFLASGQKFSALEVGCLSPEKKETGFLETGQIGYVVTGIKNLTQTTVGDTITQPFRPSLAMPGYMQPRPVVWASIYPENQNDFDLLRQALMRLKLSDSSIDFEEEVSGHMGRGFKCGFLGMLHLEIITERMKREFNLSLVIALPTISYEVAYSNNNKEVVYTASLFPDDGQYEKVLEPWIETTIMTPSEYLGSIMQLLYSHEGSVIDIENHNDRNSLIIEMPLRELMRNFFDELKSVTSGFASLSYKIIGMRQADVTRLDIFIANELVPALSRVVPRYRVEQESNSIVEKLKDSLPRQMFDFKIQAKAQGRIVASRSVSGMKKDVTDYLYGGDITRKMKLREKQKKGKKKMKAMGKVNVTPEIFLKIMKSDKDQ